MPTTLVGKTVSVNAVIREADGAIMIQTTNGYATAESMGITISLPSGGGGVAVNPDTIVAGQVKIAVTGTAVQLPNLPLSNGLVIKSKSTNSALGQTVGGSSVTIAVDGTGNGYVLDPGEAASFGVTNASAIYVNGQAGDIFSYEGN